MWGADLFQNQQFNKENISSLASWWPSLLSWRVYVLGCLGSWLCLIVFCDLMYGSPPGSSAHGIFQARILEWVSISSSRESSWLRDRTCVSCVSYIGKPTQVNLCRKERQYFLKLRVELGHWGWFQNVALFEDHITSNFNRKRDPRFGEPRIVQIILHPKISSLLACQST